VTILWTILWLAFAPDLASVKAEPDLDRRSELALANADQGIDSAREALTNGDIRNVEASLGVVRQSVELSYDSLHQTREKPRHSKFYKHAELKILALLRRLTTLRDDLSADEREPAEAVIHRLRELHDQLLTDIMSKRKP
jgi:hypothetical protein